MQDKQFLAVKIVPNKKNLKKGVPAFFFEIIVLDLDLGLKYVIANHKNLKLQFLADFRIF